MSLRDVVLLLQLTELLVGIPVPRIEVVFAKLVGILVLGIEVVFAKLVEIPVPRIEVVFAKLVGNPVPRIEVVGRLVEVAFGEMTPDEPEDAVFVAIPVTQTSRPPYSK
jgi:hypothetical protein